MQVRATGTSRGPAFRQTGVRADHLLFFELNLEELVGEVVFNGPEHHATALLPANFVGQRSLTREQIRRADRFVADDQRLALRPDA